MSKSEMNAQKDSFPVGGGSRGTRLPVLTLQGKHTGIQVCTCTFLHVLDIKFMKVHSGCNYSLDWTTGLDYWTHL